MYIISIFVYIIISILLVCSAENKKIFIFLQNNNMIEFEDCWLRDHCRCSTCYVADMYQRAVHLLDIPECKIKKINHGDSSINITWSDGHKSSYKMDFLLQNVYTRWIESRRFRPILWHGQAVGDKVPKLQVKQFLSSESGAKLVFKSLLDYGFALIEGVEPTLEGTEEVCKALGGIQHTMFGGMWKFTTEPIHADTAYTNLSLAVHNDSTYLTESTGLQVLHCVEHKNGSGGETILVDGFYGATRIKEEYPEDYKLLSTYDLEAEYIEKGHQLRCSAPVIKINQKTGDLKQIRFNTYDRAPMAFASGEECRAYYRALRNLARFYQDPNNQFKFKLRPGLVLVIDNFRVLHGRTAFSGSRVLCGSYVARSDWLDRARTLKLIA